MHCDTDDKKIEKFKFRAADVNNLDVSGSPAKSYRGLKQPMLNIGDGKRSLVRQEAASSSGDYLRQVL